MDWLFRIIEAPFIWLSHRPRTAPESIAKAAEDSLGIAEGGSHITFSTGDLARHTYILGSTGCGKTSLILQLIARDIGRNHTVAIVDLRGDLIDGVLGLCDRLDVESKRVTLLDLREKSRIQGFNPLKGAGEPYIRALHTLDAVKKEAVSWGVQLEETLRAALLVLAETGEPVSKLESVFFDAAFRTARLKRVTDRTLVDFWERFGTLSPEKQQAWAIPVLNKVSALLAVPTLRQVLGSTQSLDLEGILSEKGHIFLVSLAVDELHASSRILGSILLSAMTREMMARVNVPEQSRNPVRLYVDEFENMASESFEGLIAEGRRFGLTLVLSHQTLSQLPARLRSVVRNNVGVQILFQLGFEDARHVAPELPGEFDVSNLRSLAVGQAIVMYRDGEAVSVQFHKPKRASTPRSINQFRDAVLARLPAAEFEELTASEPEESAVDLEDWL